MSRLVHWTLSTVRRQRSRYFFDSIILHPSRARVATTLTELLYVRIMAYATRTIPWQILHSGSCLSLRTLSFFAAWEAGRTAARSKTATRQARSHLESFRDMVTQVQV